MEKSLEKLQEALETTQVWELTVDNFINESTKINTLGSDIVSTQEFRSDLEKKMQSVISIFIKKHIKELLGCKDIVDSQENSIESLQIDITCLREENEQLNEMSLSLIKEIKGLRKYINESDILVSVLRGEMYKQRRQNKLLVDALKQIYEGNEEAAAEILTKAFALGQSFSENDDALDIKQKSLENSFTHSEDELERNFVNDRACQSAKLKVMLQEFSQEESSISSGTARTYPIENCESEIIEESANFESSLKTIDENENKNQLKEDNLKVEQEVSLENYQSSCSPQSIKLTDTCQKCPEVKKQILSKWLIPKKKSNLKSVESHGEIPTNPVIDTVEDKIEVFVEKSRKEAINNTMLPFGTLANLPLIGIKELLHRFFRKS